MSGSPISNVDHGGVLMLEHSDDTALVSKLLLN